MVKANKILSFLIIGIFLITGVAQGVVNNDILFENQEIIEPNNIVDIGYYIEQQNNISILPLLFQNGEELDQYCTTTQGYGLGLFYPSNSVKYAQSFKPRLTSLVKVELYLFKIGNPTGTIRVSIKNSLDVGNYITQTKSVNSISYGWTKFYFDNIELVKGQTYYIVVEAISGNSYKENAIYWLFDAYNGYRNGDAWIEYKGDWIKIEDSDINYDFCFKTYGYVPEPPNAPKIDGNSEVRIRTLNFFEFTVNDPESQDIYLYIDWGDDTTSNWLGPFHSGEKQSIGHSWKKRGDYIIKAKAKDTDGLESGWSSFETTLSKPKQYTQLFREHFPFFSYLFSFF